MYISGTNRMILNVCLPVITNNESPRAKVKQSSTHDRRTTASLQTALTSVDNCYMQVNMRWDLNPSCKFWRDFVHFFFTLKEERAKNSLTPTKSIILVNISKTLQQVCMCLTMFSTHFSSYLCVASKNA